MSIKKTKIICTIGPAVAGVENLLRLINSGMDIARINFSHGTFEDHKRTISEIREASKIAGRTITILQDLQGPKIRTSKVENGSVPLTDGANFIITADELEYGNSQRVSTVYKNLPKEVKPGNIILLDDGYIILEAEAVKGNDIITKVIKGGNLKNNKGIIIPGSVSLAPSLSEKDLEDLKFGLAEGVDAVALSFIRSPRDVIELKTTMKIFGRQVPIVSKIERFEAVEFIDQIIDESDAVMVARGDLGLETPAEKVPILQKEIIAKCIEKSTPVIIATQMLESMIENPRPTRAEASDVANAVIDMADCLMLSAETSVGKYPFDAVDYMKRIILSIEQRYSHTNLKLEYGEESGDNDICDALGKASYVIAGQINAKSIVCLTSTGSTAGNVAKYRPYMPIIVLTDNENTLSLTNFMRDVHPFYLQQYPLCDSENNEISRILLDLPYISTGDKIVIVAGISAHNIFSNNFIRVAEVGGGA